MLTRFIFGFGILILLSLDATGGDEKKDQDLIQGSWKVVKLEFEGHVNKGPFKGGIWVFKDKEVTVMHGDRELVKGTFVLDPDKKPKTIEMTGIHDEEIKDKTSYGIYRIEKNTLTICHGDKLPKEFSGAGKAVLLQFERVKSE
jgi:uncharacterized protein (TIGR03067 family)